MENSSKFHQYYQWQISLDLHSIGDLKSKFNCNFNHNNISNQVQKSVNFWNPRQFGPKQKILDKMDFQIELKFYTSKFNTGTHTVPIGTEWSLSKSNVKVKYTQILWNLLCLSFSQLFFLWLSNYFHNCSGSRIIAIWLSRNLKVTII